MTQKLDAPEREIAGKGLPAINEPATNADRAAETAAPRKRMSSVDAFRGLTILGMLLVNNIALDTATPQHLTHALWNQGLHFADMIFPWFLFAVGIAIPFSAAGYLKRGGPAWKYDLRIFSRTVTLFLLGCAIDSSIAHKVTIGLGVLQVIGLAYFCSAFLYELPTRRRFIIAAGLLLAHWAAIRFVPVPGAAPGAFTEASNLIKHLNETYLTPLGLKGLVSVVPTTALVLIGTLFGDMLSLKWLSPVRKGLMLFLAGGALAAAGWAWNLDLPFNKPVWSSSYILFSGGLASMILGFLYLTIDAGGLRAWAYPLIVFGANAITAYVLPILVKVLVLQQWTWTGPGNGARLTLQQTMYAFLYGHLGRIPGGWTYTAMYILFWWLVLFAMYRKKIFVRV